MREIKFRGKCEDGGEWVYGSFIPDALEGSNSDLVSWGFIRRYNRGIGKMETIEVDRETVGQYTGLKDKNGKEIYEGDIVQFKNRFNGIIQTATVIYCQNNMGFILTNLSRDDDMELHFDYAEDIEVIGDIYDNPELLDKP